jgi:RNA polymerase subunit RPABC4/transcription elongation factor Spt4
MAREKLRKLKCKANTTSCRKCHYRYLKTDDKSPGATCPQCGEPRRCDKWAVAGFEVCNTHGAGSKKRPGGRPTQTGIYSKYLPKRIASRYEEFLGDPTNLDLDNEIAIAKARLSELLERADSGESYNAWADAKDIYTDLTKAIKAGDVLTSNACLQDLNKIIGRGVHDYASWAEIRVQTAHYVKLVESQRKRQVENNQMITAQQLTYLMAAVIAIVGRAIKNKEINDTERFNVISAELNQLLYIGAGEKV